MYVRTPEPATRAKCRRYLAVAVCSLRWHYFEAHAVTTGPLVLLILDYWPVERLPVPFLNEPNVSFESAGKLSSRRFRCSQ